MLKLVGRKVIKTGINHVKEITWEKPFEIIESVVGYIAPEHSEGVKTVCGVLKVLDAKRFFKDLANNLKLLRAKKKIKDIISKLPRVCHASEKSRTL